MVALYNRARMTTATTGTGTITLGSAVSDAFLTFAEAGVQNGDVVPYTIEDGNDVEVGIGTYTSSGTTLSRDTVRQSKIGGVAGTSKINLSGSATVFIGAHAEDLYYAGGTDVAVADGGTGASDASGARTNLGLVIGTDILAQQTIGIANDNLLEVDGSPNSAEYARFTANGLEGRTEAEFKADFNLEIGTDVQAFDADTLKADTADTLTAGFAHTPDNDGTQSSGTYTPDEAGGNMKHIVNGGAFTLAPPTNDCCIIVQITNNGSAGAITTSGFSGVFGDSFTTTNGDDFICTIIKINGFSSLTVQDVS